MFKEKVYSITKKIPKGRVSTYRDVAHALNCRAYRAVGNALNKNKHPIIIPCHRVVSSNGSIGGYSGGIKNKIKLLKKEGIGIRNNKIIDFEKVLYKFK